MKMGSMNLCKLSVASLFAVITLQLTNPTQGFNIAGQRRHGISQHQYQSPLPGTITNRQRKLTKLHMGFFDFLKSRDGDFVKLEDSIDIFGPGPLVILYNMPNGILDDEVQDMIQDGAPKASATKNGVITKRIYPRDLSAVLKDDSVSNVLEKALSEDFSSMPGSDMDPSAIPILYFSGFSNKEMMQTYNIIAGEIYHETQETASAACAKLVAPALGKSFRQLIEEISGDHAESLNKNIE